MYVHNINAARTEDVLIPRYAKFLATKISPRDFRKKKTDEVK